MAYYSIEPFGEQVADWRHGIAVSTLANINRDTKARSNPYKATDFIWWHAGSKEENGPVLIDDPDAQTEAMIAGMFGNLNVIRADKPPN